jgi:hypothetical protein
MLIQFQTLAVTEARRKALLTAFALATCIILAAGALLGKAYLSSFTVAGPRKPPGLGPAHFSLLHMQVW